MSGQVQYPNDRVDINGNEWPTVGENIRKGCGIYNASNYGTSPIKFLQGVINITSDNIELSVFNNQFNDIFNVEKITSDGSTVNGFKIVSNNSSIKLIDVLIRQILPLNYNGIGRCYYEVVNGNVTVSWQFDSAISNNTVSLFIMFM